MALTRIERAVDDEYLLELIGEDTIGRNEDLRSFISLLNQVDGGFTFLIDGAWGTGKTVFVRQAVLTLQTLYGTHKESNQAVEKALGAAGLTREPGAGRMTYLPIYFNAWENDTIGDPVVALLAALVTESGYSQFGKAKLEQKEAVAGALDGILRLLVGRDGLKQIVDSLDARDFLKEVGELRGLQNRFKELIAEMLRERADKLALFIDELDRCTPAFALRLIEGVKFLLAMDNVIVVFSTNATELAHTVEGYYGEGFDGGKYLTRYYDMLFPLQQVKPSDFLKGQVVVGYVSDNSFAYEVPDSFNFSMRDCQQYKELAGRVRVENLGNADGAGISFLILYVLPVLPAISIIDGDSFSSIIGGTGEKKLLEYAQMCPSFPEALLDFCKRFSYEFSSVSNRSVVFTPEQAFTAFYRFFFTDRHGMVDPSKHEHYALFRVVRPTAKPIIRL